MDSLAGHEDDLVLPAETPGAAASWFGFALTVRPDAPYGRRDLVEYLRSRGIDSRQIFAGNLLRQPAYAEARHRVAGALETTDVIAERSFWVGCYPGLERAALDHVVHCFDEWRRRGARRAA
jgi:CDP-6-deoxy-D-xylo-4-hexulose-3-dehydrase